MPKTFLGLTWMSPKSLLKEIEHSVTLLSEMFDILKEEIPNIEDLPTLRAIFEEQVAVLDQLFFDRTNNIWVKTSKRVDLFRNPLNRVAEMEIVFHAHRFQWMAQRMIRFGYLQEPSVIPACVNMLEAMSHAAIAAQVLTTKKTGSRNASQSPVNFTGEYERIHAQLALTRIGLETQRESLENSRLAYEELKRKMPKM